MRKGAWIWLALLALLLAGAGLRLRSGGVLQTDLLAMLPETERNPVAEQAVRTLAKVTGDRAVFLLGPGSEAKAAAPAFADALSRSGAFSQVQGRVPPLDPGVLTRFYAGYRFRLPAQPVAGGDLRQRLEARLASPLGALPGLDAATDPLGELQGFLSRLPFNRFRIDVEDGLLLIRSDQASYVLVSATLPGSAFDPRIQRACLAAVAQGEAVLAAHPGVELLRTGAVFYAADARASAEWETGLISWGSLAAIVASFLLVFRSARHLLLGLLCVGTGLAAALAATLAAFGQLHLLTLVCGASMVGVAVDYPVLYFAHHLGGGAAWDARAALRRLLPALTLGWATTLLGYLALGAAPFPGLRQMAVFSMAGLAASFLTTLLVLPDALRWPAPPRPRLMAALERGAEALRRRLGGRAGRAVLALAGVLLLAGACKARVDDDVRGLITPSGRLLVQERRIRELTGLNNSTRFFLVEGPDEAAVLAREEALRARLGTLAPGEVEGLQAVSAFVPSPALQAAALEAHRRQAPELDRAMRDLGFRPEALQGAQRDLEAGAARPLTVADWLAAPFSAPFRHLWLGDTGRGRACMALFDGTADSGRLRQAIAGLPGVTLVDKAGSVSALLGHYRRLANGALAAALVLVALVLARWYGWRRGLTLLAPTLAGMLAAVGLSGWLGLPLTLFGSIALVLVLGFAVDYAVFLADAEPPAPALLGVALAAGATLLSYGLLAFSHTPALRGFGLALGSGVLAAALLAPLTACWPRRSG
jgi:predicted exporter